MSRKQHISTVIMALVGGLVGGMVSGQLFVWQPVFGQDASKPDLDNLYIKQEDFQPDIGGEVVDPKTLSEEDKDRLRKPCGHYIRDRSKKLAERKKVVVAEEFLLVDKSGNILARLGVGSSRRSYEGPCLELWDKSEQGCVSVEMDHAGYPTLSFQGPDGGGMLLYYSGLGMQPSLMLYDKSNEHRIILGMQENGEPYISLSDKSPTPRAVLGTTELKHEKTGSTEIRAPSSLVLFDEKGKVVWSAP